MKLIKNEEVVVNKPLGQLFAQPTQRFYLLVLNIATKEGQIHDVGVSQQLSFPTQYHLQRPCVPVPFVFQSKAVKLMAIHFLQD